MSSSSTTQDRSNARRELPQQRRAQVTVKGGRPARLENTTRSLRLLPVVALGGDLVAVALAVIGASIGRDTFGLFTVSEQDFAPQLGLAAPVVTAGWVLAIALLGGYDRKVFGAGTAEARRVLASGLVNAAVVGVVCYLVQFPLSRAWFVLVFLIGTPLLLVGRLVLRALLVRARRRGLLQHRVLVVGDESHIDDIARVLKREDWLGYHVIGALAPTNARPVTRTGVTVLADTTAVVQTAIDLDVDVVVFAGGAVSSASRLRQLAWDLEHTPIQVVVAPSLTDVSRERVHVRPVGGLPLINVEKPRSMASRRKAKRIFDIAGSLLVLAALSPLYLFAVLQIWLHDRGPILFRQERIGRDGEAFACFKFRSMVVDAEAKLAEVHAAQGSDSNTMFYKLKHDPRITKPGRWMRRFSVDELPQLLNVVKGDMSLVGPRPQVSHEVALYDDVMSRRLRVRPGMTGLWQVSGRSDLPIEEAMRLDLYYVDNWSMVQDLNILARTLGAVVGSRGAY